MSKFLDSELAKWRKWFDMIQWEVLELDKHRHLYLELREIVKANPALLVPSFYWEFARNTYAHYITAGVRRQVKLKDDSISLLRLLESIKTHPNAISRDWFHQGYNHPDPRLERWIWRKGEKRFNLFAKPSEKHVSPQKVTSDIRRLRKSTADVERYVDRIVAHRDRRLPKQLPTLANVHRAVKVLLGLVQKYHILLERSGLLLQTSSNVGEEWKELFKIPWIREHSVHERG